MGSGWKGGQARDIEALLVVVPARDEAVWLPGCLTALARALRHPAVARTDRDVVVVLDRCRDASAAVVGRASRARTSGNRTVRLRGLPVLAGSAGGARRLGVADGLARLIAAGHDPTRIWITSTDADSLVPPDWLAVHAALATDGADMVRGTVVLAATDRGAAGVGQAGDGEVEGSSGDAGGGDVVGDPASGHLVASAWEAAYRRIDGHPHVHGANLGVRASAYLAVGGFPVVRVHEDALLARAVERAGGRVVATAAAPVSTSARMRGRTPGGVAADLRRLRESMDPPA